MKSLNNYIKESMGHLLIEEVDVSSRSKKFGFVCYDENSDLVMIVEGNDADDFVNEWDYTEQEAQKFFKLKVGEVYSNNGTINCRIW